MIKMLASVAIAAAALAAAPAAAQEANAAETLVVYGDLNIGHSAGRAMLDRRIRAAARQVCGIAQAPGLAETIALNKCRAGAIEAASAQVEQVLASRGSASAITVAARR